MLYSLLHFMFFDSSTFFPDFINKEHDALHVFGNLSY